MEIGNKILSYYGGNYFSSLVYPGSEKITNITEIIMSATTRSEGIISDRTGTFEGRYKVETLSMPDPITFFNKSFAQICYERVIELLRTNKTLLVTWSGGIDSTAILASLLMFARDKNQIKVVFERRSIEENESFYLNHIKDKLNHEITDEYWANTFKPKDDELLITGNKIPQIFGFSGSSFMENRNDPWEPYVKSKLSYSHYKFFMEKSPLLFGKCPFPLVSIFDMMWWICFTLRWTNSETRFLRYEKNYPRENYNNLVSFFDTQDFQYWSIFNHDKKIKDTSESFKYVLKDIIFSYDKNLEYKNKMVSLPSAGPSRSKDSNINSRLAIANKINANELPVIVDTDFNYFTKQDIENNKEFFKKLINKVNTSEWIK